MEAKKVDLGPLLDEMNKDPFNTAMLTTLQECQGVLARKRHDYGDNTFVEAAENATILCGREIKSYEIAAMLVGIKMARYGFLIGVGREGMHEPIADTVSDLINYVALMERERQKYEHKQQAKQKTDGATQQPIV